MPARSSIWFISRGAESLVALAGAAATIAMREVIESKKQNCPKSPVSGVFLV